MKTVYLDTVLVSAIVRDHQPAESAPFKEVLKAANEKRVSLVTSKVAQGEIDGCTGPHGPAMAEVCRALKKVPFVDAQTMDGINSYGDQTGWYASPRMDDDPVWAKLFVELGLSRHDAHHVMLAINSGCEVFLTADKRTILKRKAKVEAAFPQIKLMSPFELVSSGLLTGS